METRTYTVWPDGSAWIAEYDGICINFTSRGCALEMAINAARYDVRGGRSAKVLLRNDNGNSFVFWQSDQITLGETEAKITSFEAP